jgi:two-component system, NtrC family, response regulator AtoC
MLKENPNKKTLGHAGMWNPVPPDHVLFGNSAAMGDLRDQAYRITRANIPVLLTGEGGTGKEAVARWIHCNSDYAAGEFVKVNCAAIPGTLLESELFGFERGAFTGANFSKPGRVELAHRGTLFLDEIADLDLNLQSKLLHFLQDGTFCRIGAQEERKIDVRLLCATNKDLQLETDAGRFRKDLFYRIHVFRLNLPLLRQRREDIPELAEYFRQHFQTQFGTVSQPFTPEILDYLQNLQWPGNIRELSNVIARYVLIGPDAMVYPENKPRKNKARLIVDQNGTQVTLKRMAKDAIKEVERNVILETLRANQWNRRKTAQELKISYRALIYKIQDAGLVSRRASVRVNRSTQGALKENGREG